MIYKISTDKTTVCIGSFTSEVAGQFSYSNGKSAVYAFNIHGATDEGLSIANIVTGKAVVVPFADATKIKVLNGDVVTMQKFDNLKVESIASDLFAGNNVTAYDANFDAVTITGFTVANKVVTFTLDGGATVGASDLFVLVETHAFGK